LSDILVLPVDSNKKAGVLSGKPDVDPAALSVAPEGIVMVSPDWPTVIVPVPVLLSMVSTFKVLIILLLTYDHQRKLDSINFLFHYFANQIILRNHQH